MAVIFSYKGPIKQKMRIWDINPGYLNRQSLLGEHRELHGIVSIIVNNKKGYSKHPETMRWADFGWALKQRHHLLAAEMSLRGFKDKSPVFLRSNNGEWPRNYIDEPCRQFEILKEKYRNKEQGRIFLPHTAQQLWSHHKYSILARNANLYKKLGRDIAGMGACHDFSALANLLSEALRKPVPAGGVKNALQHMWGYVSENPSNNSNNDVESWSLDKLLKEIQRRSMERQETYLLNSTALSDLVLWVPKQIEKRRFT